MRWCASLVVLSTLAALPASPVVSAEEVDSLRTLRVSERHLRSLVERSELPDLGTLRSPPGLRPAVAEVMVSQEGRVVAISILEAPTLEIAESLQKSLKRWGFASGKFDGAAYKVGKLTFYVGSTGGDTVIKNAEIKDVAHAPSRTSAR